MSDYIELSRAIAAAAEPCFNDVDREFVHGELDAGAVVREDYPLPADLVEQVRGWLAGADGGVPAEHRQAFHELLHQVRVTPPDRAQRSAV